MNLVIVVGFGPPGSHGHQGREIRRGAFEAASPTTHDHAPVVHVERDARLRSGVWNVYSVSRSTRAVTPLTHFTSASGYVRDPAWSPRGNRIVFERAMRTGGVWTIASENAQ